MINVRRVRALILRYVFLYSRSSFRLLDIFFWPLMDLLVWGFVSMYMLRVSNGVPAAITFLIGAIIFWSVLYHCQQAVTISFLQDIWSRNLLNIFVAPVRPSEFVAATYCVGLVQSFVVVCLMGTVAVFAYSYSVLVMGWYLLPLFANLLIMGWALGLMTTAMILRWGNQAEALAWAVPFLIQPVAAVFYPVSVLPSWLQPVAMAIPATHVFEGMRQVLQGQPANPSHLVNAVILNCIYMVVAALYFNAMFKEARERGLLAKIGTG